MKRFLIFFNEEMIELPLTRTQAENGDISTVNLEADSGVKEEEKLLGKKSCWAINIIDMIIS